MFLSARMQDLPYFKYNPDALAHGIIKKQTTICPVCAGTREYVYDGPFYSEENVTGICPWCIADGRAADEYEGEFVDEGSLDEVIDEDKIEELTRRTPAYTGWQQEQWPNHCEDFCAFKGYVGWKEISSLKNELKEDLAHIEDEYEFSENDLRENLVKGGDMQGYLFQCLHCNQHRLLVDAN